MKWGKNMTNERLGLIDVGSNTVRLVIFDIDEYYSFSEVQNIKTPARLVQYIENNLMSEEGIQTLIGILKSFKGISERYKIHHMFPVATAAIRQSDNAIDIIKRVRQETGIELKILSEKEEAFYGNYAVRHTITQPDGITIDIGGGSTELALFKDKQVVATHSFPFGAVSLRAQFFNDTNHNDKKAIKKARKWVKEQFHELSWLEDAKVPLIGIGGSARNIADVYQRENDYPIAGIHGYTMDADALNDTVDLFASLSMKKLEGLDGLSSDRKDIIIPAGIVFSELLDAVDTDSFIISTRGLREGVILEYLNEENNSVEPYTLNGVKQQTVFRLSKQYNIREIVAGHRVTIADQLLREIEQFEEIIVTNQLDLELIYFGASLYYLGTYIEDESESQHTFYIISNTNLHGFSHRERVQLALVASYKNKSLFKQYTKNFKDWFTDDELKKLLSLGSIVKFAEALNDSHVNIVQNIELEKTKKDGFILTVTYKGEVIAEEYRANKQKNHLERVLGDDVEVRFISETHNN